MEKRRLGTTDLEISPIGLGAWVFGGSGWELALGPQDDSESIATIRCAVKLGINWIDTAAVYGLGHSEEVVGRALAELPPSSRPYVFTKCSMRWDARRKVYHSLEPASIRQELEESLRRLRVEAIDLYQIHWPSFPPGSPVDLERLEAAWRTLAELQREGKVRHLGASNFGVAELERVARIAPSASVQPPYSLIMRGIEDELLPWCQAHPMGVLVYSPLQLGLLTGAMSRERIAALPEDDFRRRHPSFKEPRLSPILEVVEVLRRLGIRHGRSPGEIAIAWTLRQPVVTAAIVGARRPSQVEDWVGAATFRLSPEDLQELHRVLPPSAPPLG